MLADPLLVVGKVVAALERVGVRYVVGGSVASSVYGIPRATQDVDVVVDLRAEHVTPLAELLAPEFYVDEEMIHDAVRRHASCNVIHLATMFKADLFVPRLDSWTREELARGRVEHVGTEEEPLAIRFASPEDTLLHKLIWYRLGNEVSDRQWGDAQGILKVQGNALDAAYLDQWADGLGVADLLRRARKAVERA
jgi:hypothetical protein